jgi:hypothetical protein
MAKNIGRGLWAATTKNNVARDGKKHGIGERVIELDKLCSLVSNF